MKGIDARQRDAMNATQAFALLCEPAVSMMTLAYVNFMKMYICGNYANHELVIILA